MDSATFLKKMADLAAQCPAGQPIPEDEASKLPIHVERIGVSGPRVLIIHGGVQGSIGGGSKSFIKHKALAEMGWQIELVERPGFGRSPSRGVDDMNADAAWIFEMLAGGAHLIGHSWGGGEALLAAARRPQAVSSLILIEPAVQGLAMTDPIVAVDPEAQATVLGLIGDLAKTSTPSEFAAAFLRNLGAPISGLTEFDLTDTNALTELGCSVLRGRTGSPKEMRQAAEIVAKANIPTLVIGGGWSKGFELLCEIAARATNGRHVLVPSPNHFPQFESPDEFNRVVDKFMRDSDQARPSSR